MLKGFVYIRVTQYYRAVEWQGGWSSHVQSGGCYLILNEVESHLYGQ
jgi:hypothetical protein